MTQRQQYALVPREPTEEMRLAAWLLTGADPVSTDDQMAAVLAVAIEAAPPPPEQVLSDEEIYNLLASAMPDAVRLPPGLKSFARAIERAALNQLGAKNV